MLEIYIAKGFNRYTEEDYNLVMNTNVASFFYMTRRYSADEEAKFWACGEHLGGFRGSTGRRRDQNCWPCCRNRHCRLRVRRCAGYGSVTTSGFNTVFLPSLTRRCTLSVNHAELAKSHPLVGW